MLGLATTKTSVRFLASLAHSDIHGATVNAVVLSVAICWLLGLNVSIQPLQSGVRALIVDNCPAHQQTHASAWASQITGIGNIAGYFFGYVPLHNILPFLHITQFSWLCTVASVTLSVTVVITCMLIKERDPRSLPAPLSQGSSFSGTVKHIIWSTNNVQLSIRRVYFKSFVRGIFERSERAMDEAVTP